MGRHSTAEPTPDRPEPEPVPPARPLILWLERVALGIAAGAGILFVLRWAGTSWAASLWIAAAVAVVVPAFAWLAATVPSPTHRNH